MQNIFPVIDTHSIKHVINHIIPDSIFKIYIYLFVWIFFIYSGFIHKFMDNDIEVRNDLLWITFSILTFRHCFKLHHHLLFLLFISHSHILPLPLSLPPPLYASQIRRTPNNISRTFLFCFWYIFCVLFLHNIAQYSRLLGAISCICLHLKNFYLNPPIFPPFPFILHSRNVISNLIDFCIFLFKKCLCFSDSLWWLLLKNSNLPTRLNGPSIYQIPFFSMLQFVPSVNLI